MFRMKPSGVPQHRDRQHGEQARDVQVRAFRPFAAERIAQTLAVPRVEVELRLPSPAGPAPADVGQGGEVPADRDHHARRGAFERANATTWSRSRPRRLDRLVAAVGKQRGQFVPRSASSRWVSASLIRPSVQRCASARQSGAVAERRAPPGAARKSTGRRLSGSTSDKSQNSVP